MHRDKRELTVPFSGMNQNIKAVTLSDRLMKSLVSHGLVRGIIPMSMRKRSNQLTLDFVLKQPDGDSAEEQKTD